MYPTHREDRCHLQNAKADSLKLNRLNKILFPLFFAPIQIKIYPSPNMFWQRRSIFGSYYASLFGLIRLNRHLVTPILKSIYKEKKNTIGFINIIPSRVYHRYPNLFIKSLFSLQSTPGNFAPLNPRSLAFRNPIHPWSLRTNETNP